MVMNCYTMKEIMQQCDMTADALRYYEKIGLLPKIQRKQNNHRLYTDADKKLLLAIKCLKKTGMSLEEIRPILKVFSTNNAVMDERMEELLRSYQDNIKQQQNELQQIWDMIEYKLQNGEPFGIDQSSP